MLKVVASNPGVLVRKPRRLTPAAAGTRFNTPGEFAWPGGKDCEGLCQRVKADASGHVTSRIWIFRYRLDGKRGRLGLGSADKVGSADAEGLARKYRALVNDGHDPKRYRLNLDATFAEVAEEFLEERLKERKITDLHRGQWCETVRSLYPAIGVVKIASLRSQQIANALRGVWKQTPITGQRLRGRVEEVIEYAIACDLRADSNPATYRRITKILEPHGQLKVRHHAALPWQDMPAFMAELQSRIEDALGAVALKFTILTVKRSIEVRGAEWPEIDFGAATWTIPAARMKMRRDHIVPLSTSALALLETLHELRRPKERYIFPAQRGNALPARSIMAKLLTRMGYGEVDEEAGEQPGKQTGEVITADGKIRRHGTVHGFRSSFKEWSRANRVELPDTGVEQRELTELALAHLFGDDTERAYGRDELLELRRPLMQAWDDFIIGKRA